MSSEEEQQGPVEPALDRQSATEFTIEKFREALKKSEINANELSKQLKEVFALSNSSSALRLR